MGCPSSKYVAVQPSADHITNDINLDYEFNITKKHSANAECILVMHKSSGRNRIVKIYSKARNRVYHGDEKTNQALHLFSENLLKLQTDLNKLKAYKKVSRIMDIYHNMTYTYLVLEICEGGDLVPRLLQEPYWTENNAAYILKQVLYVLEEMHANKLVHGNLRLDSILMRTNRLEDYMKIKLINFENQVIDATEFIYSLNQTIYYSDPESIKNEGSVITPEDDIWSTGIMLYMMLTGLHPFFDADEQVIKDNIIQGKINYDEELWNHISPECQDLIHKMLRMDPKTRITAKQALEHEWLQSIRVTVLKDKRLTDIFKNNMLFTYRCIEIRQAFVSLMAVRLRVDTIRNDLFRLLVSLDKDGSTRIPRNELIRAYKTMKFKRLQGEQMTQVIDALEKDDMDRINYEEFSKGPISSKEIAIEEQLKTAIATLIDEEDKSEDTPPIVSMAALKDFLGRPTSGLRNMPDLDKKIAVFLEYLYKECPNQTLNGEELIQIIHDHDTF